MRTRRDLTETLGEMTPPERKRLGRLGGLLLVVGSLAAVPAAALSEPAPSPAEYLIIVAGVAAGAAFMAAPWDRLQERALYSIPIAGTGYVLTGVSLFSSDFAFYLVLIAVYSAYVVRARRDFLFLMAFFTVATIAPLAYTDEGFKELVHQVLVGLPVMIISAAVVRYLRDTLDARELKYRRFAVEAVTLAERIRGGTRPAPMPTPEDVDERLAALVASSHPQP